MLSWKYWSPGLAPRLARTQRSCQTPHWNDHFLQDNTDVITLCLFSKLSSEMSQLKFTNNSVHETFTVYDTHKNNQMNDDYKVHSVPTTCSQALQTSSCTTGTGTRSHDHLWKSRMISSAGEQQSGGYYNMSTVPAIISKHYRLLFIHT